MLSRDDTADIKSSTTLSWHNAFASPWKPVFWELALCVQAGNLFHGLILKATCAQNSYETNRSLRDCVSIRKPSVWNCCLSEPLFSAISDSCQYTLSSSTKETSMSLPVKGLDEHLVFLLLQGSAFHVSLQIFYPEP